jgi:hypothetical protein
MEKKSGTDVHELDMLLTMVRTIVDDDQYYPAEDHEERAILNDVSFYKCPFGSVTGCYFLFESKNYEVYGSKTPYETDMMLTKLNKKKYGKREERVYNQYRFYSDRIPSTQAQFLSYN